jgi:HAD superfamily hydrolase (TIGR01509 family)
MKRPGLRFRAAIFDLDGTLIDSMSVWKRVDRVFLAKRGITPPPDYFDAVGALGFLETALYTIERFSLDETADELMREWNEMVADEYAHNIKLKPGAGEYLVRLRDAGIKTALATSSTEELCASALSNNGIDHMFDAICTVSEVGRGKEFPDIFIYTSGRLGVGPEGCLVFEDNIKAAMSAKAAGMAVLGVYDETVGDRWDEMKRIADGWIMDFNDAPEP